MLPLAPSLVVCREAALLPAPVVAATLAAVALAGCQTPRASREPALDEDVLVVAHRACWRHAAENSLEGLQACIEQGVDIAEVDVRSTRDGVLVLMHDPLVNRTTNGSGRVSQLTYAQLQKLNLKAGRGGAAAALTSYKIPTLAEALRLAEGKILLEIDIKDTPEAVMAFLREHGGAQNVVMGTDTGFDPELDVHWRLVVSEREAGLQYLRLPDGSRPFAVSANWTHAPDPAGAFARIRAQGSRVWSVTLTGKRDTPAAWEKYIRSQRCAIHTDQPAALLRYLRERQLRD